MSTSNSSISTADSKFPFVNAFMRSNPSLSEIADTARQLDERGDYWIAKSEEPKRYSAAHTVYCSIKGYEMKEAAKELRAILLEAESVLFPPDADADAAADMDWGIVLDNRIIAGVGVVA